MSALSGCDKIAERSKLRKEVYFSRGTWGDSGRDIDEEKQRHTERKCRREATCLVPGHPASLDPK